MCHTAFLAIKVTLETWQKAEKYCTLQFLTGRSKLILENIEIEARHLKSVTVMSLNNS